MKVRFLSPGTFFSEEDIVEVDTIDPVKIASKGNDITQRYGAKPYGFRIEGITGTYYIGGRILTMDDIPDTSDNHIIRANMRNNGWPLVIENTNSYKVTMPFAKTDKLINGAMVYDGEELYKVHLKGE